MKKEKKDTESIIRLPAMNSVANFSDLTVYIYKNVPTSKNRTNSCAQKEKSRENYQANWTVCPPFHTKRVI